MSSSATVISAFMKLGQNADLKDVFHDLTYFVLDLYHADRPENIDTLSKLRWYMFSKKQLESEKLPPTKSDLLYVMHRSDYMALVWKSSHLPHPSMSDPKMLDWRLNEGLYEAV